MMQITEIKNERGFTKMSPNSERMKRKYYKQIYTSD